LICRQSIHPYRSFDWRFDALQHFLQNAIKLVTTFTIMNFPILAAFMDSSGIEAIELY